MNKIKTPENRRENIFHSSIYILPSIFFLILLISFTSANNNFAYNINTPLGNATYNYNITNIATGGNFNFADFQNSFVINSSMINNTRTIGQLYNLTASMIANLSISQLDGYSGWNLSGTNLFSGSNSYNVGIGTAYPQNKLTVKVSSAGTGFNGTDGTGGVRVGWDTGYGVSLDAWDISFPRWGIVKFNANVPSTIMEGTYLTNNVIFNGGGNVGIGNTNPTSKLEVVGNVNISGNYTVGGTALTTTYYIRSNDATQKCINVNYAPTGYTDAECSWINVAPMYAGGQEEGFTTYTNSICTTPLGATYGLDSVLYYDVSNVALYFLTAVNSGYTSSVLHCTKGDVETVLAV